ncbi:MAG: sodium:calcium antiporter [Gemmatimonadetes bacterium]|nr:sodium:calcium antiporter [Gemmatimonadota bacterium]
MIVKPLVALVSRTAAAGGAALAALWTFPSMLLSAFLVAWGAEAAQFLISQGLALAVLAWLQTLPEFAVEAVIAWEAGKDQSRAHLAIANLTGAIRLLVGLAWPMIYCVAAFYGRKTRGRLPNIELNREHAVEVLGLLPPLLYFAVIYLKRSISIVDAVVLIGLYVAYLWILWQCPPHEEEELDEAPAVSRWAYRLGGRRRTAAITGLFLGGGLLLYLTAHPFLESMLAMAALIGVSDFVLVQWVAPFLSEFPEKISAFYWARRVHKAPMALMNMVSSNINQWTVLAAMIPIVYGWSRAAAGGGFVPFDFDAEQQVEIGLTLAQSLLAMLVLFTMRFGWLDAASLFVLWAAQFFNPSWREEVTWAYLAWCAWLLLMFASRRQPFVAPRVFIEVLRENRARRAARSTEPRR